MNNDWIDRRQNEPKTDQLIIVWVDKRNGAPVSMNYDYGDWQDVVEGMSFNWTYWQPAPTAPAEAK